MEVCGNPQVQYRIFQAKIYVDKTGKLDLKNKNGVLSNFKDLFWQMVCTIFLFRVTHKWTDWNSINFTILLN